ncbi:MAG: M23 family metallopeptidase [Ruminococcaceae bacterium]|nr:M23 family metallopeptidase [Oscillospiraceae bacterium]
MAEEKENIEKTDEPKEFGKAVFDENTKRPKAKKRISDRVFMVDEKSVYMHRVKKLWKSFRNHILSGIIAIACLTAIFAFLNTKNYVLGYELIIDGNVVGYIDNTEIVDEAIGSVAEVVKPYIGKDEKYTKSPEYVRRLVVKDECLTKEAIESYLLKNLDYVIPSWGIYVDGKFVTAVPSEEDAKGIRAEYLKRYCGVEYTDETILETKEKYTYSKDYSHAISEISTFEEAISILAGTDKELEKYVVVMGDTLSGIAEKFGMRSSVEIIALNPNLADHNVIHVGDEILVEKAVPLLSVIATMTVEYEEAIPYEIETEDDPNIFKGEYAVVSKGVEGKAKKIATVKTENGIEYKREILSEEIISEPVTEVRRVGTKTPPQFINPASGYLSSQYGRRWGRNHNGIDIAGSHGSAIKASSAGTVTYSGWMSGYGYYVVINHGNGYETAYGHNSSLLVSVGQYVSQGQTIAKMGNTGRSTGTHLHFEVKKNGVFQNPLNYVSY